MMDSSSPAINFINVQDLDLGSDMDIPNSFDWRENGVNDTVESQGACWSCWAFTAITNIESQIWNEDQTFRTTID